MTSPVTAVPAVVAGSPRAHSVYRAFAGCPYQSDRVLVRGRGGSGKSALVGAITTAIRACRVPTAETLERFDPTVHAALLIDDAHLLPEPELARLTDLVYGEEVALLITAQQTYDSAALTSLVKSMESVGKVVELAPLDEYGVASAARAQFGTPVSPKVSATIFEYTDGLSYLVDPSLRQLDPHSAEDVHETVVTAVHGAVADRLRLMGRDAVSAIALCNLVADLDEADLRALLDLPPDRAHEVFTDVANGGLLRAGIELAAVVRKETVKALGAQQLESLARSYFQLHDGEVDAELAVNLAAYGVRDTRLCRTLLSEAQRHRGSHPSGAVRYYRAAVSAAPMDGSLIERANVACRIGLFDDALRDAESVLDAAVSPEALGAAARVAASAWCARGMLGRGADLYAWLGPERIGEDGPVAALLMVCAGDVDAAAAMESVIGSRPPTSEVSGNRLLARAMLTSLQQPGAPTLNLFSRSLAVLSGSAAPLVSPDSAVAVAAIAALHAGDLRKARAVLQRGLDGEPAYSPVSVRLRLLLAWTAMLEGNLDAARSEATAVGEAEKLPLRERFLAEALRVGLARRRADTEQVHAILNRARETFDAYSVDLLSLSPVGELWSAASWIGKTRQVRHLVDEAFALVKRLGDPPFWTCALHWYGLTVAIQSDSTNEVTTHARALRAAGERSEYGAALAAAGRAWVRALAGELDIDEILSAATALQSFGHGWDASNLAARAALRCSNSRMSAELLHIARTVGQPVAGTPVGSTAGAAAAVENRHALSERQREVAALLVAGLTYKGVGERLFISPKTVEYHVANIKRQIGTESRSELISRLHALDLHVKSGS